MKSASVHELKNRTSALLRQAAREEVLITSRGRPVACLVGLTERDLLVSPTRTRRRGLSVQDKKKMFRLVSRLWRLKPEKGKTWVSQEHHDAILCGNCVP